MGSFLSLVGTAGYYSRLSVIWRTIAGMLSIGSLYFLTNAIQQASINIQQVFSTLAGIADQALFLTDLLAFFEMQPTIRSKPQRVARTPSLFVKGFEFRNVSFQYPGSPTQRYSKGFNFRLTSEANASPSSVKMDRARPRSSSSLPASTIRPRARYCLKASIYGNTI